jgi:hypothetical protein
MPFTQAPLRLQPRAQKSGQKVGSHGGGAIGSQAHIVPDPDVAAVEAAVDDDEATVDAAALDIDVDA